MIARIKRSLEVRRAIQLVWGAGPVLFVASIILQIASGLVPLSGLFVLQRMVDTVSQASQLPPGAARDQAFSGVLVLVGIGAVVAILTTLCDSLGSLVAETQSQSVIDHMQGVLHLKAVEVDVDFYENAESHNQMHRAQEEAPSRPSRIVRGLAGLGQNGFTLLAVAAVLTRLHPLVLPLLAMAAIPGVLTRLRWISILHRWQIKRTSMERRAGYFHLLLTLSFYAKEVRLFNLGPEFIRQFREARTVLRRERVSLSARRATADILTQSIAALPLLCCLAYVSWRTIQGELTIGALTLYYGVFSRGQSALQGFLNGLLGLHEDNLFLAHVYEFLDMKPKVSVPAHPLPVPAPMASGLRFEDVQFAYPGTTRQAVRGVNMCIQPGQVVALVGENGSGKTTLIKLLCRLYDPDGGRLTVDGMDMRDFAPDDWRQQISVVFQDYAHYDLPARENIRVGNLALAPDDPRIEIAARDSGAHEVIVRLPRGYDTVLGKFLEDGEELSIGQWQKVAIARAFVRPAQIVVLDEPTAALDPEAEAEVFDSFRELIRGRAAILISHRLSTVKMADCIYVMEDGRIVESGSHDALIAHGGTYARLFETQAQHYR